MCQEWPTVTETHGRRIPDSASANSKARGFMMSCPRAGFRGNSCRIISGKCIAGGHCCGEGTAAEGLTTPGRR